jgi:predicted DsbA family dithiol-disulfide isomerase
VAQKVAEVSPGVVIPSIVAPMQVEIWSDVVCPWCFIGKVRFDKAVTILREKGITEPIDVVFRAYQLDPTAPIGAPTPVEDAYAKKFGGRERAQQILQHVTNVAAEDGIQFNMDIALRANTIQCHRALHWALTTLGAESQIKLKERLLKAYFTDGLDVGDTEVIVQCAGECGFDAHALNEWLIAGNGINEVQADLQGAAMREITAVPSFVINDQFLIPGAQDPEVFVNVIEKILSR